MADFGERIYELAVAGLEEQERAAADIRGRGAPLLAGGAVVAGLLSRPIFTVGHPIGFFQWAAAAVGLAAAATLLISVVFLWLPDELGFSIQASTAYRELWDRQLLDQPGTDLALARAFDRRMQRNTTTVNRLAHLLAVALGALVVETAGLALAAALAS